MAVKLHRCSLTWLKVGAHPCWRVQRALDEAGIEYQVVTHPLARGRREALERLSGQRLLPVVELEDGRVYREESRDMAAAIRAGRMAERARGAGAPPG